MKQKKKVALPVKQPKKKPIKRVRQGKGQKGISKKLLIGIAILFIMLFVIVFFSSQQQVLQGNAATAITPSFAPLGPCSSNNNCPTTSPSAGGQQLSIAPGTSGAPATGVSPSSGATVNPCTSAASVQHRRFRGKGRGRGSSGGGGGFFQFIMQLFQMLLQLLQQLFGGGSGGNITIPGSPTPSGVQPSGTPATSASPCPPSTSGAPSGTQPSGSQPQPSTAGGSGGSAPAASSGFVTASGQNLMLNGKQFKFIGFDAYGMTGCYSGTAWTTAELDTYFSSLPADGVTRLWAMQDYGTGPINTILTEAAKYNQHVILTLSNESSTCDTGDGASGNKSDSYFQSGYTSTLIPWINTIVPMFKANKSIMMWEVMNEPVEKTESTMQSFLQATSNAIRADDPNHLIAVGSNDSADYGGESNFTAAQNLPNIDAIGFHDYAWDYEGKAEESGNFTDAQSTAKSLNKPFYTGEAGVEGGSSCNGSNGLTPANRVTYLTTKATDYFNGGLSGILFWEYEPSQASWVSSCAYEMYPGDPMIAAVKSYQAP